MLIYLQMIETPEDQSKFIIMYEENRDYMYRVALAILHNILGLYIYFSR